MLQQQQTIEHQEQHLRLIFYTLCPAPASAPTSEVLAGPLYRALPLHRCKTSVVKACQRASACLLLHQSF
eukprot:5138-Heterococcus_DN1.PRE.1